MNKFKFILYIIAVSISFSACETYDDPEVEYSPVFPVSGEYWVYPYQNGAQINTRQLLRFYNTSANDKDSVWVRVSTSARPFGILAKSACNVTDYTLSITNGKNIAFNPVRTFTILEGKVMLGAASVKPSGVKPDSVYLRYETNGVEYVLAGYRRTGWPDDEMH